MAESMNTTELLVILCAGISVWMSNAKESSPIRRYAMLGWGGVFVWALYSAFSKWRGGAVIGQESASAWFASIFMMSFLGLALYAYCYPSQSQVRLDESLAARAITPSNRAQAMFRVGDSSESIQWNGDLDGGVHVTIRGATIGLLIFMSAPIDMRDIHIDDFGADLFGSLSGKYRAFPPPSTWEGRLSGKLYSDQPERAAAILSGAPPLGWLKSKILVSLRDGLLTVRFIASPAGMNPELIDLAHADFIAIRKLFTEPNPR